MVKVVECEGEECDKKIAKLPKPVRLKYGGNFCEDCRRKEKKKNRELLFIEELPGMESIPQEGIHWVKKKMMEGYFYVKRIQEMYNLCDRCGFCCRNERTEVTASEIVRLSNYLDMKADEFEEQYLEWKGNGRYIISPCPFLNEDDECEVYPVRPFPCRTYPFSLHYPHYGFRSVEECGLSQRIYQDMKEWDEFKRQSWDEDEKKQVEKLQEAFQEADKEFYEDRDIGGEKECMNILMMPNHLRDFLEFVRDRSE